MIRSLYYSPGKPIRKDISPQEFPKLIRDRRGLLWVDFLEESPENCLPILQSFGFHHLAIDDALQETHAPKIDDWGNYLYIVLNYMNISEGGEYWQTDMDELDIFLGHNYIVTHHDHLVAAIDKTWEACDRDPRIIQDGADHLLYKIADNLVADYMPVVEKIDAGIDELEDQIFDQPSPRTLERLFALKRVLLAMRRILLPQREVLNKLARDDYNVIDPKDRIFFRDIYDHLVRLHDLNESLRDLVSGALDSYLSVINNRMNEVMKTLTLITTLFMPLTFITGFFGMNFFEPVAGLIGWTSRDAFYTTLFMPLTFITGFFGMNFFEPVAGLIGWTSRDAFYTTLLITALLPIGMYIWMRRRTWV